MTGTVGIPTMFARHPKVLAAGPTASYLYLCSRMWSEDYDTDGFIPVPALNMLAIDAGIGLDYAAQLREVKRLVNSGLWRIVSDDSGWLILGLDEDPTGPDPAPLVRFAQDPARSARPNLAKIAGDAKQHECAYCRCTWAEAWDHILPRSRGGPDTIDNLAPACQTCNLLKGAKTPEEWWATKSPGEPMPDYWPRAGVRS